MGGSHFEWNGMDGNDLILLSLVSFVDLYHIPDESYDVLIHIPLIGRNEV